MWYEKMFAEIESEKNEEQAIKMAAYMKNNFPFLGIPKPKLDFMIKPYIKAAAKLENVDWDFIFLCWDKNYREAQYTGAEYICTIQKKLTDKDLDKLKHLIVTKSWWDITDGLDKVIGYLSLEYPSSIRSSMLEWSSSDNIWLRRVAIDFQQKLKEKTDTELLEKIIINNFGSGEFFINKAIGWSLRDYSKINPEWVSDFLENHKDGLSKLSIKEASKYLG
jgi:3-methyladenine DNA glycosylase AlkD